MSGNAGKKSSNVAKGSAAGKILLKSSKAARSAAASALTQRVIKESSKVHGDALKRLVDR